MILEMGVSAFIVLFSFGITYLIVNAFFHKDQPQEPAKIFSAFKITRENWKQQIIVTLFLICVIYEPLDLVGYLIPGMLGYSASAAVAGTSDYLVLPTEEFFFITFMLYFAVAIREEFYFRNFVIVQGERNVSPVTALLYSTAIFGLGHFAYIFSPIGPSYPLYYPIIWGLSAVYVGIIAGYVFLRNRTIWPLIIAHLVNNVVSATVLRDYLAGNPFYLSVIFPYSPFLILGVILLIIYWKKWLGYIRDLWGVIKSYRPVIPETISKSVPIKTTSEKIDTFLPMTLPELKPSQKSEPSRESNASLFKILLIDIFFIVIIWFLNLLFF